MIYKKSALLLAVSSVVGFSMAEPALAQSNDTTAATPERSQGIADIIVTARKREESAQRVPISVTNLSAAELTQKGIKAPEDLALYVPGVVFRSGGNSVSANFSIRGQVSSDVLLTIAPAVGLYENSGNIPHPVAINGAFFDIDRIEVLKGPQGTLYGRNTTGGAINIITKGADFHDDHGYITAELGNYSSRKITAAFGATLIDDVLAVRVAGQHWTRNGYGQSLITNQRFGGDHDDDSLRGSILFTPTPNITSKTTIEYVHLNRAGYLETLVAVPAGGTSILEAGLESGCATSIGSPSFSFSPASAFAACANAAINKYSNPSSYFKNYDNARQSERAATWHVVEDLSLDLSDSVRLRSITTYHRAASTILQDTDGSPFQILETYAGVGGYQPGAHYVSDGVNPIPGGTTVLPKGTAVGFPNQFPQPLSPNISYHQWSQEFNLTGNAIGGRLNWLVGAFGSYDKGNATEPAIAFDILTGGGINNVSNTPSVINKSWGIFTQDDFKISDQFSITGGLRYSQEYQDLRSQPYRWSAVTGVFTCTPAPPAATFAAPGNTPNNCGIITNRLRSDGISYLASLNFQATPDILFYAKTSRGFRGGALQLRSAYQPGTKPEIATDYEIGVKSEFLDHRLRFNFAGYHTEIKNKQEQRIVPTCNETMNPACNATQSILFNAAKARVNGFEAEAFALPAKGLSVGATAALIAGKYTSFPNAPDQNSLTNSTFNATGLPFREPKYEYTLSGRYEHPVASGILSGSLDWSWQSHFHINALQFPTQYFPSALLHRLTDSVGLLSARVDYNLKEKGLVFSVSSTNVLNNHYEVTGLFSRSLGIGTARTGDPRFVYFTITKKFGAE